jgi:Flp pilus assembly protein TadD
LRLFLWPRGQNLDWDVRPSRSLVDPAVLGAVAILAAVAGLAWRERRRHPAIAFGVALFFLALLPTSSFVRSADLLFEHRAYLPMVGLCLALGELARIVRRAQPRAALLGLALLVTTLAIVTTRRNAVWDTEASLWSDVVAKSPDKVRGHVNLGMARQREGRLDEAATHFRRALDIEPRGSAALTNLGNVLRRQGRATEAESLYRRAIERDPRAAEPWINLGNLAVDRADLGEAETCFRRALVLAPEDPAARYNLAKALEGQRRFVEAIAEYEALTRERPEVGAFFNDLGAARILAGEPETAERDLRRAIELRPDWEVPRYNLGLALEARGRVEEAQEAYRESLEIAPGWAAPLERLRARSSR